MSKRDPAVLLEDVLASIEKITRYTHGWTKEQFMADDRTMVPIAIVSLVIAVGVYACKDEGCMDDPEFYCEDNTIYRCIAINRDMFEGGPSTKYIPAIDCAKYGATCQEGITGYIPRDVSALMDN